ncbi:Exocyst complex component Sec8 [Aphelenchoides besseyi]|nr:Exocyst complex component Sec8 [Aphelenchoides besseyi]
MVRKLKHHEQKLLKKVDFIDWKDNNLNENKIMARFSIRKREEYTYYNGLARSLRELAQKIKDLPDANLNKKVFIRQLLGKCYDIGLIPTADTLERLDRISASSFCRRRLPTLMKKTGMIGSIRQATQMVEQGHVRVGQELITDPAYLVTRDQSDFVTWAPGSKIGQHSGLLINVVRTLAKSASVDQRDLAKRQLEDAHSDSGKRLDRLLNEHEDDVKKSVSAFRDVFKNVRACRERVNTVRNGLQTSRSLLQSRRDELKKLWMENLEQKENRRDSTTNNLDRLVDQLVKEQKFCEAFQQLKKADILLSGPLNEIDGLKQLKTSVYDSTQNLLNTIIEKLLQWLVVEPFDRQLLEVVQNLNENTAVESSVCQRLLEKYGDHTTGNRSLIARLSSFLATDPEQGTLGKDSSIPLSNRLADALDALTVFDQLDSALRHLNQRRPAVCKAAVNDMVALLSLIPDTSYAVETPLFHQLVKRLIHQMCSSFNRHKLLALQLKQKRGSTDQAAGLIEEFWSCMQDVMRNVVSDHVDIHPTDDEQEKSTQQANSDKVRALFRFSNTASWASTSTTAKRQLLSLICTPDLYNIIDVFELLNRFCAQIEGHTLQKPCKLETFLHTFVMDTFIERIRKDMENKIDQTLLGSDVWTALSSIPGHQTRILTSCLRVFELCKETGRLINEMERYTIRFASIWVLIMEEYTRTAKEMYRRITHSRVVQGENMTEHAKISATWAVDEDISRLLKSLPSWTVLCPPTTPAATPISQTPSASVAASLAAGLQESEQTVRQRTQRESEILISNLGVQREIERTAMITDLQHATAIACMHESLQWFCTQMRMLIGSIPAVAQKHMLQICQIRTPEGGVEEQKLSEALESRLQTLDSIAETCLLMMHLELRVHCFYHLLPLARPARSTAGASATGVSTATIVAATRDDTDPEVTEFGRDLQQFHQMLAAHIAPNKVKYLFDGLGHLCASIFINSSQHMQKLPESGQKRVCRNIFTIQRHLSHISGRPETELNRAQSFFELVNRDPDELLARIMESKAAFTYMEYTYLLALSVRTNTSLSAQPGVLDRKLKQLQEILAAQNRR